MDTLVTTIHFVVALVMIGLILLQQGKGASMGASFGGGSSNTVFGSSGGASLFAKVTAILAVTFFVTSLGLTLIARNEAQIDSGLLLPALETEAPAPVETPVSAPSLPVDQYEVESFSEEASSLVESLEEESSALQTDSVESAAPTE